MALLLQAYRIQLASGAVAEDCNDDGEAHAGSRVLHLLNVSFMSYGKHSDRILQTAKDII